LNYYSVAYSLDLHLGSMRNLNGGGSGVSRWWKRSGYLKKFDNSLPKTNKKTTNTSITVFYDLN